MNVILYHGDCPDGWCSAYVALKRWPDAQAVPVTHGQPAPVDRCRGKDVLVVDFSWSRVVCDALFSISKSFKIIDHHKTAEHELRNLSYATFDLSHSGAMLTWFRLFPNDPPPWYVPYVEDGDLFRFILPDSRAINAYLMALPHTREAWDTLEYADKGDVILSGSAIRLHIQQYVNKLAAQRQIGVWNGHTVAAVNAPYLNISDVCEELLTNAEIGMGYFDRGDGLMQFSLRSKAPLDVSAIAKSYGGGGHAQAAGFEVSKTDGRALLDTILETVMSHG